MADGANFESLNFEISVNTKEAAQGVRLLRNAVDGLATSLRAIKKLNVHTLFAGISSSAKQAAAEIKIQEEEIRRALDKLSAEAGIKDKVDASLAMQNTFWSFEQQTKWYDAMESARDWPSMMANSMWMQPGAGASGAEGEFYEVEEAADEATSSTMSLADAMQMVRNAMSSVSETNQVTQQLYNVKSATDNAANSAENAGGRVEGSFSRISEVVGGFGESIDNAIKSTRAYSQVSKTLETTQAALAPAMQAVGVSTEAMNEAFAAAVGPITAVVLAIQVAVKVATFLVDQFNEFNKAMKQFVDTAKAINEKFNPFVALRKELESLLALAKRQIMRRAINAVIKSITEGLRSGIENLAEYDEQFSATMESFRNAMGLFKNSIGVAVAPIISYFIPAINALLSALTRAMNTLARLTALLTGQHTYTIAKDYQEIGESAGGASGKVKELQRTILGFDEINKLNGQNGSGGGGGGGAGDSINAYETLEVGEWPYDSWGAALLDFIKWLDGVGVPKLRAGFDKVSKFVNEFSRNLFDALTFDGVQDAISNLATHIGETLNNFLTGGENNGGLNWADMGKALGMAIQTAFNFAANFLLQLDFFALGKSLAEFINKAIEQIKPEDVANVLFTPIRAAFGLVVGFLADFDFPEFAQKAGAVVNNMITSLAKLIGAGTGDKHGGKWQSYFQIAVTNIANGIVALFDTIDWAALFDTLTTIVSSIIDGLELILNKLMQNKEFVNAVHRFVDFIINTAVRWFILKIKAVTGLAGNMSLGRMIGAALFGGGDSLIESGGNPLLDAFNLNPNDYIDGMEEAADATEDFSQAANIAALTTKNSMSSIDTASTQMAQHVDISGRNVVNAFRTMTTDSGKPLSDLSKNVNTNFTNAKNSITNNMASAKNAVTNNMNTAKSNAANATEAIRADVANKFSSAASTANSQFANMRDNIKARIAEGKNGIPAFNDVGANIKNGVIAGMGDFKGQLNNWCNQFKSQILNNFKIKSPSRWARDMVGANIGEGISLGLEESTSSVQKACEGLKEGISSEFSDMGIPGNVDMSRASGADLASALGNYLTSAILTAQSSGSQQPIVCEVYLDRDRIASAVTRGQQAQNRRYSSTAMA